MHAVVTKLRVAGVLLAPPPLQTDLYFNVQKNT